MTDYVQIIAVIGVLFTFLQEIRIRKMGTKMLEIADHASNAAAYVRDRAKNGGIDSVCTQETLDELALRGEEIWGDLEQLGGSVKDMLDKKRGLANSLNPGTMESK